MRTSSIIVELADTFMRLSRALDDVRFEAVRFADQYADLFEILKDSSPSTAYFQPICAVTIKSADKLYKLFYAPSLEYG